MAFTAMEIAVNYNFSSNASSVLRTMARETARTAEASDELTGAIGRGVRSMSAMSEGLRAGTAAMRDFQAAARGTTRAIDLLGTNVARSQRRMAAGFGEIASAGSTMADEAARTARRVTISSSMMADASETASYRVVRGAAAASERLSGISGLADRAVASMSRFRASTASMGGTGRRAVAGDDNISVGGIGGLAALAAMGSGVGQAARLQDSTVQTAVAMGRSSAWARSHLTSTAMDMSRSTAQSVADSMGLLQVMATSGFNDEKSLTGPLAMQIAKFADTQYLGKHHVAFDDSAAMAVKIAHQFGARTPAQLSPILNTLWKMSQDMPDTLQTAATQLKYYDANFSNSGVNATETLMLQAAADRMGYGSGRSGSGFNQILRTMQSPSKKELAAQIRLGEIGVGAALR